jgi:hypothetical protein
LLIRVSGKLLPFIDLETSLLLKLRPDSVSFSAKRIGHEEQQEEDLGCGKQKIYFSNKKCDYSSSRQ